MLVRRKPASDSGHSRIVSRSLTNCAAVLKHMHAAELYDPKRVAIEAISRLHEKDRTT